MANPPRILAIDHGTSGIKAALFDVTGALVDFEFAPTPVQFLPGGGAEQDPEDWCRALVTACRALVGRCGNTGIEAVCVSSTFSTTVAVDRDGKHVMNALTWMDSRGAPHVKRLMGGFPSVEGYAAHRLYRWVRRTGGGPSLSGKDDIAHVLYVKHERPDVYDKTAWFLPSKDYLNLRLTGEVAATHDSITLFWVTDTRDLAHVEYDDGLIELAGLDRAKLPRLCSSIDVLGTLRPTVAEELGLPAQTKVIGGAADHQAALIGSGAVRDFEGHLYIGTSSWVQCVVPFKKTDVFHSIASLPAAIPGRYQSVNEQDMAGGALAFLADKVVGAGLETLGVAGKGARYDAILRAAEGAPAGANRVLFAPWLNGERTPVDDHHLRAALFNVSASTTPADMARAVLEGVAYNTRWSERYVERFAGQPFDPLRIIGGGARSPLWCQIFADVLDREIHQVKDPLQANARGAAIIGAVGLGHIHFEDVPGLVQVERRYVPQPANRAIYDDLFEAFVEFYRANKALYRKLNA